MEHVINMVKEPEAYQRLKVVAEMLNLNAVVKGSGTTFYVGETYLDFGQNWMWTTILADNSKTGSSWQALNPREWKEIYSAEKASELARIAEEIASDKYFIA